MPKYGRKKFSYKRKAGSRKPRSYSRKKYRNGKKLVTMRMLRNVVAKPELKFHTVTNYSNFGAPNEWAQMGYWRTAWSIGNGSTYNHRLGNDIMVKYVVMKFALSMDPGASHGSLAITTGEAGAANTVGYLRYDSIVRITIFDDDVNPASGDGLSGWPTKDGSNSMSASPGGASQFYYGLDKKALKTSKRTLYLDKKYKLATGIEHNSAPIAPSDIYGPMGMPNFVPTEKTFTIKLKFPGVGKKISYHPGTSLPTHRPIAWIVGKNQNIANNPQVRVLSTTVYFTDA